jgi:hypothetical protein
MPIWVLICDRCKSEFVYSQLRVTVKRTTREPAKPHPIGNQNVCPTCGHSGMYKRTDFDFARDVVPIFSAKPK